LILQNQDGEDLYLVSLKTTLINCSFCLANISSSLSRLVTNSSDRTIRQFILPNYPLPSPDGVYLEQELEPTHRFNDPINKTAWYAMCYSPDGEWLAGGMHKPNPRYLSVTLNFIQVQPTQRPIKYISGISPMMDNSRVLWMEGENLLSTYTSVIPLTFPLITFNFCGNSGIQPNHQLRQPQLVAIFSSGIVPIQNVGVPLQAVSRSWTRMWSTKKRKMNST
jgi:hypothetical protein